MNRIAELREKKGLSQAQLGKLIGAAQNTISNWENGNRKPDYETLKILSDLFNCSIEYIMGEDEKEQKYIEKLNIHPIKRKKIRLLGEIACGQPIFADEDRESYVMAGTDINADFCLKAKGDSMVGARIRDGDIVFIKETPIVYIG